MKANVRWFDGAEACKLLDIQIENLREARDAIACPYNARLSELETMIRLPMLTRAKTNLDALDMVCAAKIEIKEAIWAFREEKTGEPSITIKVEEAIDVEKTRRAKHTKEIKENGKTAEV